MNSGKATTRRGPGRPPRVSARKDILASAARLFMRNGFSTTMSDVAVAARVSKRTLYEFFANKLELYEAVLTWLKEGAAGTFAAQAGENVEDVLLRYGVMLYDTYTNPRMTRFMRLIEKEYERFPDLHRATRAEFDERYTKPLAVYFVDAKHVPEEDAFGLARGFTYWIIGELTARYVDNTKDDRESFIAYVRWTATAFVSARPCRA